MQTFPASDDRPQAALRDLLRTVPRRYRSPPLPPGLDAAVAAGTEATLAFAIESARAAAERGTPTPAALGDAFTAALAALIHRAMTPDGGDPVFQAQVLYSRDAQVRDWVQIESSAAADARSVRAAVDAFAHPGKLRDMPEGARRDNLSHLHALAAAGEWRTLASEAGSLGAPLIGNDAALHALLHDLATHPALQRRIHAEAMTALEPVRRYRALRARRVPPAGSDVARGQGRAAAREGAQAEHAAAEALRQVATFLNDLEGDERGTYRVLRSLLTPRVLSGGGDRSKEEWDAALVRSIGGGLCDIVLLAEVKAAPAAVTSDMPRLLRGLARLAQADGDASFAFASLDGAVRLRGRSLRALAPIGPSLPEPVIYLCPAPTESRPTLLGAAAKAVLLSEPASLEFARALADGAAPLHASLTAVWNALPHESRLRATLNQYDTARRAREAMLYTGDLLATVAQAGMVLPRQSAP
ncbi:hypothetical protein [Variovorax sp. YR216]|uniref:hypothetical protein n=1 Tax=Variovorax sp. YR216 TaxID=1882828 RepID=UPI0008966E49|nr:hypothetical protein [Variovorax sp. YR216]SEB05227.1 hypothetical protein SAMN05444680_106133 [Variovorax sp. YR216]